MISLRQSAGKNSNVRQSTAGQSDGRAQTAGGIDLATVQEYLGLTQEERWKLLVEKFVAARQNGTMTDGELERTVAAMRAVLSPTQAAELDALVARLRSSAPRSEYP